MNLSKRTYSDCFPLDLDIRSQLTNESHSDLRFLNFPKRIRKNMSKKPSSSTINSIEGIHTLNNIAGTKTLSQFIEPRVRMIRLNSDDEEMSSRLAISETNTPCYK